MDETQIKRGRGRPIKVYSSDELLIAREKRNENNKKFRESAGYLKSKITTFCKRHDLDRFQFEGKTDVELGDAYLELKLKIYKLKHERKV